MKKTTRQIVSVVLSAVLLFSMALSASASTVDWTDTGTGKTYTLTLTIPGRSGDATTYVDQGITNAAAYSHTNGTESYVAYNYSFSESIRYRYTGNSAYSSYLETAIRGENLMVLFTYNGIYQSRFTVPASYATGYYKLGVRFYGYKGTWNVTFSEGSVARTNGLDSTAIASGPLTFAPSGEIAIIAYKCG